MAKKGPVPNEERRSFWQAAMELQQESGLSVRAFCQQESLSEPSFYAWRRRLRWGEHGRPSVSDAAANFVPVHVTDGPSPLWIELADGVTLRVHAGCPPELLRTAVEALRC